MAYQAVLDQVITVLLQLEELLNDLALSLSVNYERLERKTKVDNGAKKTLAIDFDGLEKALFNHPGRAEHPEIAAKFDNSEPTINGSKAFSQFRPVGKSKAYSDAYEKRMLEQIAAMPEAHTAQEKADRIRARIVARSRVMKDLANEFDEAREMIEKTKRIQSDKLKATRAKNGGRTRSLEQESEHFGTEIMKESVAAQKPLLHRVIYDWVADHDEGLRAAVGCKESVRSSFPPSAGFASHGQEIRHGVRGGSKVPQIHEACYVEGR